MNTFPKISIVTPSYNQGKYLERTILSVVQQNYPNLEYIIIDGGSTDNSVEIIKKYESKLSYWVSEKDRGQAHALNKGFQKITGDIVAWINSDDWYEEGVFEEIVKNFKMNPTGIWLGDCTKRFENGKKDRVLKPAVPTFQSLTRYWRKNFCPPQPSIFFPHSCLKTTGFLDESLNYAMDLDLWIRMACHFNFYHVNRNLSNYLVHDVSKSGSVNAFKNFRKEWKLVCFRHLSKASFKEKILCYLDYYYHRLRTPSRF